MAKFKIELYTHKTLKNGEHPVLLRAIHNRKRKTISLGFSTVETNWSSDLSRFLPTEKNYKKKNKVLEAVEERAEDTLAKFAKEAKPFSFETFFKSFEIKDSQRSLLDVYNEIISELRSKKKLNTVNVYNNSKNVVTQFAKKDDLSLYEINYNFLKKFEAYLFKRGNTGGGVHHHMRSLRAVLNEAIRREYLSPDSYPFSTQFKKTGYSLSSLKSKAQPRALSLEDMEKFKSFDFRNHPHLENSWRMFLFSYYARGMNFTDMAKLTWSDIYDNRIHYNRSKTSKGLTQKVNTTLLEILEHFKGGHEHYIFPVLNDFHKEEDQIRNRIKKALKKLNSELKIIGKICGIEIELTSYVARHTYATTLKKNGLSVEVISEALGHKELTTTKAYLDKFSNEVLDEADKVL